MRKIVAYEWHKDEWWDYGEAPLAHIAATHDRSVALMLTPGRPWQTEAKEPGVRTDPAALNYRVHLR